MNITREALYEAVWKTPLTHLAKSYGVPIYVLTKVLDQFEIPRPTPDYWPRRKLGHQMEITPLPPAPPDTPANIKIEWTPKKTGYKKTSASGNPIASPQPGKKSAPPAPPIVPGQNQNKVPEDFRAAHPLVRSSWAYFNKFSYTDPQDRLQPTDRHECLDLTVTRKQLRRAHLIFDAIIKACARRGWKTYKPKTPYYQRNPDTRIVIEKEEIRIAIIEKVIKREPTPEELESQAKESSYSRRPKFYTATGLLCVGIGWSRFESSRAILEKADAPLENRIHEVIESLEREVEIERQKTLQREEEQRVRNEQERQRLEPLRLQEEENNRRRNLEQIADRWHASERIRSLINACEKQLDASTNEAATRWLAWARVHADRTDPLQNGLVQNAINALPLS